MSQPYYHTIIIGAGPIGIELAMAFKRHALNYLHLEAGQIGNFIASWPPHTQFFSSPEWIAIGGVPIQTATQQQVTGEEYLAYLRQVVESVDLPINTYERVTRIVRIKEQDDDARFAVHTEGLAETGKYRCRNIVLAIGNMQRHTPLNVAGVELPTVHRTLRDPHYYFQRRLLIIGAKSSACEAALRCWRAGARVALSSRHQNLARRGILQRLRLEISLLIQNGQIEFYGQTAPHAFAPGKTTLRSVVDDSLRAVPSDFVHLAIGYHPDITLYRQVGVARVGRDQRPQIDPITMESNIPGLYVAGTATGGNERRYTVFITTCHSHTPAIIRAIAGIEYSAVGNHHSRDYPLHNDDIE